MSTVVGEETIPTTQKLYEGERPLEYLSQFLLL